MFDLRRVGYDSAPVERELYSKLGSVTTSFLQVYRHAVTFFAEIEATTGAGPPQYSKDEFDAFLECGIPARVLLRVRRGDCGHDKLVRRARLPALNAAALVSLPDPVSGCLCRCVNGSKVHRNRMPSASLAVCALTILGRCAAHPCGVVTCFHACTRGQPSHNLGVLGR
jgi:hypothetical protein